MKNRTRNVAGRSARRWRAAAVATAVGCASAAHADSISDYVHLELGAGVSWYNRQSDGVWYQQGMPHSLGLSAPVLSAGFTGPVWQRESWGIDWHVDYVSLGHVSSECICTSVDANYNTQTHQRISVYPDLPPARFSGNGNAQGVSFTIEPYFRYRGFRFGVEGGFFPYRPDWDVTVYNTQDGEGVAPHTIHSHTPNAVVLGGVAGVSVGRGPWNVAYQHFFLPSRPDSTHTPAIWTGADALMVRYRF